MAASADPHLGEGPLTSSDVSKEIKALIKSDVNYVVKTKEEWKVKRYQTLTAMMINNIHFATLNFF